MDAAGRRVLIADDDSDIRELVRFKLEQAGHDLVAVEDGAKAWAWLEEHRPDLAVLDITMPGLSGIDVLKRLRADERLADLPVILLTARGQDRDVDDGLDAGADDYIVKPFSPRQLVGRIDAVLARPRD